MAANSVEENNARAPLLQSQPVGGDPLVEALREQLAALKSENERLRSKSSPKGSPGVVGFAGFGAATLLHQAHNLGFLGVGPVVWTGLIFGGLCQMIAGLMEFGTGDNFAFCAFTSYGAFWISFALMKVGEHYGIYKASDTDVGWFLVVFTAFTIILWLITSKQILALFIVFTLLSIGLVLNDVAHFMRDAEAVGKDSAVMVGKASAVVMILCAFGAWYIMASIVSTHVFGREILPVGRSLVDMVCGKAGGRPSSEL